MQTITFLNEKGGVGKTTEAMTAASGLAIKGYRVLLIDTDPQGHATVSFGAKKFDGLLRLLAQDVEWADVTTEINPAIWAGNYETKGTLHLLPSHMNNRALPTLLDGNFLYLAERLEEIEGSIDIVVFDTSPTPSVIHGMVYLASDFIVFPTECEYLSMDGLASSTRNMLRGNKTREAHGLAPINILGIQPNKFEKITNDHQDNLANVRKHFGGKLVWQPISKRTIWREASRSGKTIFSYAQGHDAETEAWGMVNKIIEGVTA